MKRLSVIFISLVLALSLIACGNDASSSSSDPNVGDNDAAVPDSWFTNTSAEAQN